MGEIEAYSSNAEASQNVGPIKSTNSRKKKKEVGSSSRTKGKTTIDEGSAQKKQRLEPSCFAASANRNNVLTIDESLAKIKIPSPVHRENIELIQQEDEEPPSPTGTKISESDNEMDILGNDFQEGMISALRGGQNMPCEENDPEEEGIEQLTILDWLKERLKIKAPVEVQEEGDDS